ncbi:MAG: glycosyltransferase [Ketobacteraceae bacterium]|nr:glycosyltransferase [Ketobacteraceae bacterium]
MRITIVSDVCYPTVCDGVASILTRTVQELLGRGHRIQLVVPRGSEMPGVDEIVELKSLPITEVDGQVMPLPQRGMFKRIKSFDPEIILFLDPRLLALQTFWLFRLVFGKHKLVATFHTDNFQYMKIHFGIPHWVSTVLHRVLMNSFSQVISVSQYAKDILMRAGVKTTTGLWAGGVDTILFHPNQRSDAFRRQLLQGEEETLALYVGRVSVEKGIDRLLPLFRKAAANKVRWVIVGDGDDKAILEQKAGDYPVTFLGKRHGKELAQAYASADLLVFPSQTDTFGLVLIEAMAAGIPVVAYQHGGVPDIITHGQDGLIVDPESGEQGLLEACYSLAGDKAQRIRMGKNARQSAEENWSWGKSINHLLMLINNQTYSETPVGNTHREAGDSTIEQPYQWH